MPHLMLKDLPRYECLLEAAREFPDLDPSAAEAYLHLLRTADDVFALSESRLTAHGISHGRFGVLMLLWRCSAPRTGDVPITQGECGPRTPAELADAATDSCFHGHVTNVIDRVNEITNNRMHAPGQA